eukprot:11172371-Lingulodinium_polyedra.AAC.1
MGMALVGLECGGLAGPGAAPGRGATRPLGSPREGREVGARAAWLRRRPTVALSVAPMRSAVPDCPQ